MEDYTENLEEIEIREDRLDEILTKDEIKLSKKEFLPTKFYVFFLCRT